MFTAKFIRLGLVLTSLLGSLWHFGPAEGSLLSLLLTVGGQVYLFGYLSARAIGLLRESENLVVRIAWVVVCGLGITIVLGAGARLLLVPVSLYVIGLHVLMLALSLIPASTAPVERIQSGAMPFYLLLVLICVIFAAVGWERNHMRLDAYPDQSLPVSLADWWANTTQPEHLVSRNVADTRTLTYWNSDGLTYVFAAWVWTGGFSAVQLIWYVLTPLFVWLVPVAHFALAYRLTRRLDTAAWATAIYLVFALTTMNDLRVFGGAWMFGQEASFQLTFHPFVPLALALSLVSIIKLRRSLTAQVVFATSLALVTISFVPPIFNAILRLFGTYYGLHYVMELLFIVPIGLILGVAVSFLLDEATKRIRLHVATTH